MTPKYYSWIAFMRTDDQENPEQLAIGFYTSWSKTTALRGIEAGIREHYEDAYYFKYIEENLFAHLLACLLPIHLDNQNTWHNVRLK